MKWNVTKLTNPGGKCELKPGLEKSAGKGVVKVTGMHEYTLTYRYTSTLNHSMMPHRLNTKQNYNLIMSIGMVQMNTREKFSHI